jgi:hypothetical protein
MWVNTASKNEPSYKAKALLAVLESDGPMMLSAVLKELRLEQSADLIKAMRD